MTAPRLPADLTPATNRMLARTRRQCRRIDALFAQISALILASGLCLIGFPVLASVLHP